MIRCQRFPVRDQNLGKNIILDFAVYLQVNHRRCIRRCLRNQGISKRKADHQCEGLQKFSCLVPGDNINQIFRYHTGHKRNTGSENTKCGIENHGFPVSSGILCNPQKFFPHLLKHFRLEAFFYFCPQVSHFKASCASSSSVIL